MSARPGSFSFEDSVGELRSKVAELENRPVNQTDVDATVAQVLSDAKERRRCCSASERRRGVLAAVAVSTVALNN